MLSVSWNSGEVCNFSVNSFCSPNHAGLGNKIINTGADERDLI